MTSESVLVTLHLINSITLILDNKKLTDDSDLDNLHFAFKQHQSIFTKMKQKAPIMYNQQLIFSATVKFRKHNRLKSANVNCKFICTMDSYEQECI